MSRTNLVKKVIFTCFAAVIFMSPVNAEGLQGFDDIFGDITGSHRNDSRYNEKSPDYQFEAPYFRKRAKGKNTITARVDLSDQIMQVFINDRLWQEWKVSSGGRGHRTPTGKYRPTRLHEEWYSRTYYNTPMPHSIFFHHGYAIHATTYVRSLGRPASHGCVRLHPQHARALFNLVNEFGMRKTSIIISQ
ncbi:MAG: L,D-transpeptidase [Methyloligellaceae bacterium]